MIDTQNIMTDRIITSDEAWLNYLKSIEDYFGAAIVENQLSPPSYPCIATSDIFPDHLDYSVQVAFIEVCDIEPGVEYNEKLMFHWLVPQLITTAMHSLVY